MPFVVSTCSRRVAAPLPAVRAGLLRALRDLQFEVTAQQVTLLEARRGSQFAAAALQVKRLPVTVTLLLSGADSDSGDAGAGASEAAAPLSTVDVRIADGWTSGAGRALGLSRSYGQLFDEVHARLDTALRAMDPGVVTSAPEQQGGSAEAGLFDRVSARSAGPGGGVARVEGWLEGRSTGTPASWRAIDGMRLRSDEGEARLPAMRLQAMLTVALLVSRSPGSMPPRLSADVHRFAARLESELTGPGAGAPRLAVSAEEVPVVRFLWEQARIRESLPLRTLQRCTTCRHEKVVNPDYKRLVERNRKVRGVGGALGASVSSHGASPFLLVGRLLPLAKLDPDYVCPRCQGLESDDRVIVFCPTCGQRRDEAVLKTCPNCSHSFRGALEPEQLWGAPDPEPVLPQPPPVFGALPPPTGPPAAGPPPPAASVWKLAPPTGAPVSTAPPGAASSKPPVPIPPVPPTPPVPIRPAAWLPDPSGRHEARWWDGFRWTDQVLDAGRPGRDVIA